MESKKSTTIYRIFFCVNKGNECSDTDTYSFRKGEIFIDVVAYYEIENMRKKKQIEKAIEKRHIKLISFLFDDRNNVFVFYILYGKDLLQVKLRTQSFIFLSI